MPQAITSIRPAITRNELAWLATLEDVESRIVFTWNDRGRRRYRAETGPFDSAYLEALPKRDWTLLVHDVEKHIPVMRKLFGHVSFVPDWRIDDLMISFAAPGGGVGPHRDNYDVFLCQGIGVRDWRISTLEVADDEAASDDLLLTSEFDGDIRHTARAGDVLYLPPGVAHWGTAQRACITYSIGMRAPQFYSDSDLQLAEVRPGYISAAAHRRAGEHASGLGRAVTATKEWLTPTAPTDDEIEAVLASPAALRSLRLHGMALLAYDDDSVYLNGAGRKLPGSDREAIGTVCATRRMNRTLADTISHNTLAWLLTNGAFEIPEP